MKRLGLMLISLLLAGMASANEDVQVAHDRMLKEIADDFHRTAYLTGYDAMSPAVAKAMTAVKRHEYVDTRDARLAYINRPLPIGHSQTISQPYIVALMTELLDVKPGMKVLEIGTGSGYQAAVLAELAREVYTIEIVAPLGNAARERLNRLGYKNIEVVIGDGNFGLPELAPFDRIIVTAGGKVPPALLQQLAPEGRFVIPVDRPGGDQMLVLMTKSTDGHIESKDILPVRFVPLTGDTEP